MNKRVIKRSIWQSYDWNIIICYLALVVIGWLNIYAASHANAVGSALSFENVSGKQFVWILSGLGLAGIIITLITPRFWEGTAIPLYLITLVLLVAVIFLGVEVKGSRSWFALGPIRFQPAEISKIATSLMLAFALSRIKIKHFKDIIGIAVILIIPMLIILGEKETGSALVYTGFIFMLYREGISGWYIGFAGMVILLFIMSLTTSPYAAILTLGILLVICNILQEERRGKGILVWIAAGLFFILAPWLFKLMTSEMMGPFTKTTSTLLKIRPIHLLISSSICAMPYLLTKWYKEKNDFILISCGAYLAGVLLVFSTNFVFNEVLQDHQRKRIEVLLGMKEDPSGVGYNVNQSMIAIGSGSLLGKGYLKGTQTTYGFVPEQHTDFIFCTVGEEWGFVGCTIVILLYAFMIFRLLHDAERSREAFTRIYGYCVACCIFMHLFINIGMTIGLMPVIGIPLPLMSYGGSSLWAFTILISIFLVLDHEEKKYF